MSEGTNLNSLLEEAQQMLGTIGEVLSSTMQQGVEAIKNYEELANDKVMEITKTEKKKLADLSTYSEAVKSCAEKRQLDFHKVEEKLRKELAECYRKHYGSLDKVIADKAAIHEEAQKLKNDLQKTIVDCTSAANKTDCFAKGLKDLKKRVKLISSRMNDIIKKETAARVKATKAVYDCDKKAVDEAYKKCNAIVEDLKRCADKGK